MLVVSAIPIATQAASQHQPPAVPTQIVSLPKMSATSTTDVALPDAPTTTSSSCAWCSAAATLKCTACKVTFYCNAEHQREHWQTHRPLCRTPYEVVHSARLGRHIVAARDIAARSVIFREAPLVVGPKWSVDEFEQANGIFPCVGCFRPVRLDLDATPPQPNADNRCPRCTWPCCSAACAGLQDARQFHRWECAVLALGRPPSTSSGAALLDYYRSDALLALRCVLLQMNGGAGGKQGWSELQQFQAHEKERFGTAYYT